MYHCPSLRNAPSSFILKRLVDDSEFATDAALKPLPVEQLQFKGLKHHLALYPGVDMVAFIKGSKHLRSVKNTNEAVRDIIAATFPKLPPEIAATRREWPGWECLRLARARLDMTAMLLRRSLWNS